MNKKIPKKISNFFWGERSNKKICLKKTIAPKFHGSHFFFNNLRFQVVLYFRNQRTFGFFSLKKKTQKPYNFQLRFFNIFNFSKKSFGLG
jgi:hypothetical protein